MLDFSQDELKLYESVVNELASYYSNTKFSTIISAEYDTAKFLSKLFKKWKREKRFEPIFSKFETSEKKHDYPRAFSVKSRKGYTYLTSVTVPAFSPVRERVKDKEKEFLIVRRFDVVFAKSEQLFRGLQKLSPYKKARKNCVFIEATVLRGVELRIEQIPEGYDAQDVLSKLNLPKIPSDKDWVVISRRGRGALVAEKYTIIIPLLVAIIWRKKDEYSIVPEEVGKPALSVIPVESIIISSGKHL